MTFQFERVTADPVPAHAREFRVRMRDGIRLATDVYRGDIGEPAPAVLVRLPYDKDSRYVFFDRAATRFTERGYVLVVQDVRGKFRSEGETVAFTGEVEDGYDTIEWITNQEWSNGLVGMFGDSYFGFTQWAAVSGQHPALRAIVPRVTSTAWSHGRFNSAGNALDLPPWLEGIGYFAHYWTDNEIHEFEEDLSIRPLSEAYEPFFEALGKRSATFDLATKTAVAPRTFSGPHPYDAKPVPVLHCVGWYDNILHPHMEDFTALAERPGWAATQYLHADAADHENYTLDQQPVTPENDHDTNDEALQAMLPRYLDPALDFFDVFLKGVKPLGSLPRVRWKLGHVGWCTAESWPPPGAVQHLLHLDRPEAAHGELPGGSLTTATRIPGSQTQWQYDPANLVPSVVANTFEFLRHFPDERERVARDDVLVFTGPPLTQPLDLAGPVAATLDVGSTAPTFDLFLRLLDVAPDGSARLIARGATQRRTDGPAEVDLGHTGYRVREGHRLALAITSSDFPNYVPNSGTTEDPWYAVAAKGSAQTLRTGSGHTSALRLTVLPPA